MRRVNKTPGRTFFAVIFKTIYVNKEWRKRGERVRSSTIFIGECFHDIQ